MRKTLLTILMVALLIGTAQAANRFGDMYHEIQIVDETGAIVTDITNLFIYLPDTTTNAVIYSDKNRQNTITIPMTEASTNTTLLDGIATWWGPESYDFSMTNTDAVGPRTNAGHQARNSSEGTLVFPSYLQSISSTSYTDAQTITMGTGSDWVINAGTVSDLITFTPATDGADYWVGSTSKVSDFQLWGASAGLDLNWDASRNQLSFRDGAFAGFGGAAGDAAADFTISHTAASSILTIAAVVADETVHFGDGTIATDVLFQNTTTAGADVHWDDSEEEWNFGATNIGVDVKFWADTAGDFALWDESADELFFEDADLKLNEGAQIEFAFSDDAVDWSIDLSSAETLLFLPSETDDTSTYNIGDATNTSDVRIFGATASTVVYDASADVVLFDAYDIALGDGDSILFGDTLGTGDFSIVDTSDVLVFNNIVDGTGTIGFGAAGTGIDVSFHGDAGSGNMLWDENQNTNGALVFDNADVEMGDGDFIQFGDGADLTISATTTTTTATIAAGSVLTIADTDDVASLLTFGVSGGTHGLDVLFQGSTAGDIVDWDAGADTWNFGVDATGVDVVFHSDTTLKLMKWVEATSILSLDGATAMLEFRGANVDAHETTLAVVEPTKSNVVNLPDDTGELSYIAEGGTVAFADAGTIPLTDAVVLWSSSGADAATLPDGTSAGQILSIVLVAQAGGNATLTPASVTGSGWATMVFTNIGESATFLYVDSTIGWLCLGTFGVSTQPLITQ